MGKIKDFLRKIFQKKQESTLLNTEIESISIEPPVESTIIENVVPELSFSEVDTTKNKKKTPKTNKIKVKKKLTKKTKTKTKK